MAIEKYNAMNNITKVVDNKDLPVHVDMDLTMASAYEESKEHDAHMDEVMTELEKQAPVVDQPEEAKTSVDNIYTKKLKLDESIDDFNASITDVKKRSNDDDKDRYIEFDMFDFIYSLFSTETDSLIRPLKALSNTSKGRGRKKADDAGSAFMYQGSDDYVDEVGERGIEGVAQISTDADGNVVLYQDTEAAFDKVIAICNEYGFEYDGPTPKKAPWLRWNFSLTVYVPTYADGYPMEVEDYFEKRGIAIEDVMPAEFIKGRAKDYKKLNDEVAVEAIFDKYVTRAGRNGDQPLEIFIKDMFKELDSSNVKYDRKTLKDRFNAEFEDDFEDED